jgi:hypothetical protein
MIGGEFHSHRLKLSFFIVKLSKRPYNLLKDYLHIAKPGVTTTAFYALLFVTYVSIGEAAIIILLILQQQARNCSLFHYK